MFCVYCGKKLEDTDRVCTYCGKPVEQEKEVERYSGQVVDSTSDGNWSKNSSYQTSYDNPYSIRDYDPNMDYNPISVWGYVGYILLFCIPLVGVICVLIFALGGTKNIHLRNLTRAYLVFGGIGLLLGIILVIIGILVPSMLGLGAGMGIIDSLGGYY